MHLIWSSGGLWERFFLLCPVWWGVFLLALLFAFGLESSDAPLRLLVVGFSFAALVDAWWTPIASTATLHATLGTGLNEDDENIRLLAEYLESLGQGGHWRTGNWLSLAYLFVMFAWGLVAVNFERLLGTQYGLAFFPLYFASLIILWGVYWILLHRLFRQAHRAGYPVHR
jgi:hypothetical protein